VTGAVNDTVDGVDGVVGGSLEETGVSEVTEKVVDSVAGPESTVGKTVDEAVGKTVDEAVGKTVDEAVGKTVDDTVKAVDGLLGVNR